MSSVEIELPNMPSQHPRHASDSAVIDLTSGRPASRPTSHASHAEPAIDVDGDTLFQLERRASRRLPSRQSFTSDDEPLMNRRRTTTGTQEHPVVVTDDNHAEGSSSSHRHRTRNGGRNQPIVVFDSDEDGDQDPPVVSTSGGSTRHRRAARRPHGRGGRSASSFRIFSPPPQLQDPAPPIIAGPMPFAILPPARNNDPPGLRHSRISPAPRNDAGIHLGGGLMSQTIASRHRRAPTFSVAGLANLFGFTAGPRSHVALEEARSNVLGRFFVNWNAHHAIPDDELFGPGDDGGGPWTRRDAALGLGPDYDPKMTHPGRAGPGWTFDFGAEDGGTGDGAEILVCALCLDPLLANAEGMTDVGDEERRNRRVWGLRCGHVLDGKCVGVLMRPDNAGCETAGDKNQGVEGKGKGKQRESAEEQEVDDLVQPQNGKGKGKAPASPQRAPTPPFPMVAHNTLEGLFSGDNSIRSRLRSRNRPDSLPAALSPARTARRSRGTKRKRGMDHVGIESEVVQDRYEWTCPVAGCRHTHLSIKVGGVWKMDAVDGAVGVFV